MSWSRVNSFIHNYYVMYVSSFAELHRARARANNGSTELTTPQTAFKHNLFQLLVNLTSKLIILCEHRALSLSVELLFVGIINLVEATSTDI